jgi:hypothetical protein
MFTGRGGPAGDVGLPVRGRGGRRSPLEQSNSGSARRSPTHRTGWTHTRVALGLAARIPFAGSRCPFPDIAEVVREADARREHSERDDERVDGHAARELADSVEQRVADY